MNPKIPLILPDATGQDQEILTKKLQAIKRIT